MDLPATRLAAAGLAHRHIGARQIQHQHRTAVVVGAASTREAAAANGRSLDSLLIEILCKLFDKSQLGRSRSNMSVSVQPCQFRRSVGAVVVV